MNICPNLSNKQIKAEFDQLVKIFGEDCAYLLWDRSNGMGLKLAPNGASSKLYQDLLELHNGDERAALIDKAKIYTQAFRQQFGKFGNTAQVKYYGPTMGKTTAAKTNKNLVDFDDVVRDDIEAAAKKAGLGVREYKKQGSEEYHNLLLDAIYKWRNDKRNVGKTLVVSNAVLAKDKIYDNTPMLPRKDAFVYRQVKRTRPKLSQIGVSFNNILNKTIDQDAERERNDATQYYDDLVQKWMPYNVVFSDAYVQDLENSSDKLDQNGEPLLFFLQTRHPDMFGSIGQPKPTTSATVHSTKLSLMQLREKVEEQLVDHLKKIGITVRGRIDLKRYLDENVISPEHPIHEYTHLWDRVVAKKNPKLWKRGIELMKQTDLWAEILLDKNYGQKWIIDPNLSDDQRDFLIASEVHARLVGKNGEQEFEKIDKKQGSSNIVEKLKKWALDVWKTIADTFSPWTKSQIQKLTLDDFVTITLRDFVLGTDISDTRMTSLELKQRLKQLGEEREKQCGI